MSEFKKVCILGLGYIGLPTVALLAKNNIKIHGVDINENIVNKINAGEIHIIEPGLAEMLQEGLSKGLIKAATTPEESDVYMIVVPTPLQHDNAPDIAFVESATRAVIPLLKENDLLIIESTSPVGTTEKMLEIIAEERKDLIIDNGSVLDIPKVKVHIAYCPERVLPGNVFHELVCNDRVIGGVTPEASEVACDFYRNFVKGELFPTNSRTAEMCKLTENASRDAQIAFANELSIICDKADINVWELINLANKHPRVNILNPGCGVGGHCIAVDPWFIASQYPLESRIISEARNINNHKVFWCADKISDAIKKFKQQNNKQPKVALMGLAFKPNIDDLRESPAKSIVSKVLQAENDMNINIVEPNLSNHHVFKLTDYQEAYDSADIVAFLVGHDEFYQLQYDNGKVILDFCGIFELKK